MATQAIHNTMAGDPILGIDFGARKSSAAIWQDGKTKQISGLKNSGAIDSTVSFTDGEKIFVGGTLSDVAISYPDRTVGSAKHYLSEVGNDPLDHLRPQVFAAAVLHRLKQNAEEDLKREVPGAVITVPSRFNSRQRQAIRDAAKIAGFDHFSLIDEPTAAALAHYKNGRAGRTVLVFDLGAKTLSTSILDLEGGVYEVVATNGDTELGGDDWTEAIVNWIADEFKRDHGVDLREFDQELGRLRKAAEVAKKDLSDQEVTTLTVDNINITDSCPNQLKKRLTRERFESLSEDLIERSHKPIEQTLQDSGYEKHDIDEVLLAGGSTKMPQVREKLARFVGLEPEKKSLSEGGVAKGAAIQGGVHSGRVDDVVIVPVTSLSLGLEVKGGVFERLIERNTTIPTEESKTFTTAADNQTSVQVRVFQGENEIVRENEFLDEFQLSGIPPAPAGTPKIKVTFRLDENGIVSVEAEDTASGDKEGVTIQGGSGLSDDEIQVRRDNLPERMERLEMKDDISVSQSYPNSSSTISHEPDLDNVSSPPRRPLTYEDIETGEPIGSGGQGVVYQAEISDNDPPDQIALKEPQQQNRTLNEAVVEAFLEEAETWEMLDERERQKPRWKSSEHIVGIIDTGDQLPWIAMEYMDGGSLGDRLADHPDGLPTDEALWIGECICRGVELAHNYGIAHLDLKPENILFRETNEGAWDVPKLADWGVSRKLAEQTGTMEALSVEYAAPEQFEPQEFGDPDMLTDIYQVGVLLYTIFTGEPPHTGTQFAVMRAVVDGKKPEAPSECRSELPAELDQIVLKAIAREKSERYRTIGVLANDLQSLRTSDGVSQCDQRDQSRNQDDEGRDAVNEEIQSPSEIGSVLGVEDKSWPMLGGNSRRTGFRPSTRGPEGNVTKLWTFEAGDLDAYLANIWSSPVVDDGTVFVGCNDGNLYALDAETGNTKWKFQTGGKVHTPAIADGTIYFGSEDETIYAVDTVDGTESWRVEAGGGTNSSPAVGDDSLFVGFDENTLAAIDLASGSKVWKYEMEGSVKSPAVRGDKVFVPSVDAKSSDNYIHALELQSGNELWTVNPTGIPGLPAVDDTTIYFGTCHCQPGFIYAVDAVTGDIRWKKNVNDWVRSSPAVSDSRLFIGSDDENLYAMDKMSGDIEWTFNTTDGVGTPVTLSREGLVFVGNEDGRIYGIDSEDGIEQWVFRTGDAIKKEVSVSEERIYVGCNDGTLYALSEE